MKEYTGIRLIVQNHEDQSVLQTTQTATHALKASPRTTSLSEESAGPQQASKHFESRQSESSQAFETAMPGQFVQEERPLYVAQV